jgi:hypothetical protein
VGIRMGNKLISIHYRRLNELDSHVALDEVVKGSERPGLQ